MKTPLGIKIGADPEMEVRQNGQFVEACEALGTADCRAPFGTDGASCTAEMRPDAGSYYEVYQRIDKLLTEARKRLPKYQLYGGSGGNVPLGGHIHFSGINHTAELVDTLNKHITKPLNTISNHEMRTGRYGYGRLNDVREQFHGGFEFRSPLSWLSTPKICNGTLAVAWVIARAHKYNELDKVQSKAGLLKYSYKRERIAITEFYAEIKNFKDGEKTLETVNIFEAWRKREYSQSKGCHLVTLSDDAGLSAVTQAIQAMNARQQQAYKCKRPLRIAGASLQRSRGIEILVHHSLAEGLRGKNHLGATVTVMENCPSRDFILLSNTLRRDTSKTLWVIKRLVKIINEGV